MMFDENIIRFEAAFDTPMHDALLSVELDKWLVKVEIVVADYNRYIKDNNVEMCRKTWMEYRKTADWSALTDKMLTKKSATIFEGVKNYLSSLMP